MYNIIEFSVNKTPLTIQSKYKRVFRHLYLTFGKTRTLRVIEKLHDKSELDSTFLFSIYRIINNFK